MSDNARLSCFSLDVPGVQPLCHSKGAADARLEASRCSVPAETGRGRPLQPHITSAKPFLRTKRKTRSARRPNTMWRRRHYAGMPTRS